MLPLHAGTYLCLASNPAGEARCLSRVQVKPGEPELKKKHEEQIQQKLQKSEPQDDQQCQSQKQRTLDRKGSLRRRIPPSFVQIFVDHQAEPGDEVLFECIINGWPKPTVGPVKMACCMLGWLVLRDCCTLIFCMHVETIFF